MDMKHRNNGASQKAASTGSNVKEKQARPTEGEPEGYEFGGPLGAMVIMVASPLLMWYVFYLPPASNSSILQVHTRLIMRAGTCGSARHTMMDNFH